MIMHIITYTVHKKYNKQYIVSSSHPITTLLFLHLLYLHKEHQLFLHTCTAMDRPAKIDKNKTFSTYYHNTTIQHVYSINTDTHLHSITTNGIILTQVH